MPFIPLSGNQVFAQEHAKRQERCRLRARGRQTKTAHQLRSQLYTNLGLIESPSTPLSSRRQGSPLISARHVQSSSPDSANMMQQQQQPTSGGMRHVRSYGSMAVLPSSRSPLLNAQQMRQQVNATALDSTLQQLSDASRNMPAIDEKRRVQILTNSNSAALSASSSYQKASNPSIDAIRNSRQ